ncbi:MAG: hypothetical protein ABI056_00205 [Caulobacteraceae bacterium]
MRASGEIARQQAQYRRGLVLGFTVAETLLLVLFALMLALGYVLMKRDRELRGLTAEIAVLRDKANMLSAKVDVLGTLARNQPLDPFFAELVRARAEQAAVAARAARLQEREAKVEKLETVLKTVAPAADARARLADLAATGARLRDQLRRLPPTERSDTFALLPQAVELARASRAQAGDLVGARQMLAAATAAVAQAATLQGQVVRLRADLSAVGKGGDYPPCWVTAQGRIQYLLHVVLREDGALGVADITPPERGADRRALPLPPLPSVIAPGAFLQRTQSLYDASRARGCRHYVTISDATGSAQKDLFKRLLFTTEAHFYKVMVR